MHYLAVTAIDQSSEKLMDTREIRFLEVFVRVIYLKTLISMSNNGETLVLKRLRNRYRFISNVTFTKRWKVTRDNTMNNNEGRASGVELGKKNNVEYLSRTLKHHRPEDLVSHHKSH